MIKAKIAELAAKLEMDVERVEVFVVHEFEAMLKMADESATALKVHVENVLAKHDAKTGQ